MQSNLSLFALIAPCAFASVVLLTAAACGGTDSADAEPTTASKRPASITSPLIHDDGSPALSDPRAVPADAAAWNRNGLYATAEQAQQLVDALGDDVLQIRVECCGIDAVDQAAGIAWGLQAAYSLPPDTPVLVSGLDLRLAAATANRLASGGLTHVWLVVP
jgi:hypothetical protein